MQIDDNPVEYIRNHMAFSDFTLRRRWQSLLLLFAAVISGVSIWILLTLLPPVSAILQRQEQLMAAELQGINRIPDISDKLLKLDAQMMILTTDSIDSRLRTVEAALSTGNVSPDQISSLIETQKELGVLKTYMFQDPRGLVELKQLQSDYKVLNEQLGQAATKDMLKSEVGVIQTIMTASFTILGILLTSP